MTSTDTKPDATSHPTEVLRAIERRVLWLSTSIVHHANRVRPNPSGLKVGGHQASSASMVTIMTALWFEHLRVRDRVSVKPHASPVLHAINYLLGELDERYLTTLRAFGGLQGIYAGGQSILVGTPSGVSLAPEGGAHQSITTPSVGLEQPGCVSYEPAFAIDVEWTLLASLARPDGTSAYLRLSTRPVDQSLAAVPTDPATRERRRRQAVAGAYLLHRAAGAPAVTIAAMGATVPDALDAADRLAELGMAADVVCVTSAGLVFDALQARTGHGDADTWVLETAFPARRAAPLVTVLDGHPHTLAFLAGIHRVRAAHLGVSRFGQSGDLDRVHRHHGLDADSIIRAALDLRP